MCYLSFVPDVSKQIAHWRSGAAEDWDVAQDLVRRGRARHGLFFAHLALEKVLKAHVCRATQDFAPRIHSLSRLSESTGLRMSPGQDEFLSVFDSHQMEGRYPELLQPLPTESEIRAQMAAAEEMMTWLIGQF